MLRVDPSLANYDWFVESYMESEQTSRNTNEQNIAKTGSRDASISTNSTHTNTHNDTMNSTNESIDQSKDRAMQHQRTNPMSAEYSGGSTGFTGTVGVGGTMSTSIDSNNFKNPSITNPTASSDGYTESGSASRGKENSTSNGGSTDTNNSTITRNVSNGENGTVFENGAGRVREIQTGRHQLPASVVGGAMACIGASESWNWFYKQLDKCFMLIYNIDSEDDLDFE